MRMTKLFSQTLREAPADAEVASHILLVRAGFIRQLGSGIFSYLPLARRTLSKIENIIRDEINAIGGQEMTMPVVQPVDIWHCPRQRIYGFKSQKRPELSQESGPERSGQKSLLAFHIGWQIHSRFARQSRSDNSYHMTTRDTPSGPLTFFGKTVPG